MQDFDEKIKKYLYYFGFGGKMLLFAQLCDRNFGGMRSRRSPKVQHIKKSPGGLILSIQKNFNVRVSFLCARYHRNRS